MPPDKRLSMPFDMLPQKPTLRAGFVMILAMASFTINDTCVKVIGPSLPVGEITAIRGIMSVMFLAVIAARQGVLSEVPGSFNRPVLLRTLMDFLGTLLFVTALMHMPIANLTAITQTVPLAVTALSAALLGERMGAARLAATATGFIGVLMIVRPNPATFSVYDAIAFGIVFAVAIRDVVTKRIPLTIPAPVVALINATLVAAGGGVTATLQGFTAPALWQIVLLALAALFLACGYLLMVVTLRIGDISATAPFRYSVMVFALISGMAVFREFPDFWAIAGMCVIVATGLLLARREARVQR